MNEIANPNQVPAGWQTESCQGEEETEMTKIARRFEMPDSCCPVCHQTVSVPQDKAYFGSRVECSACKAPLEVLNDFPLRVTRYVGRGTRGWIAEWLDATDVKEPMKPTQENQ